MRAHALRSVSSFAGRCAGAGRCGCPHLCAEGLRTLLRGPCRQRLKARCARHPFQHWLSSIVSESGHGGQGVSGSVGVLASLP